MSVPKSPRAESTRHVVATGQSSSSGRGKRGEGQVLKLKSFALRGLFVKASPNFSYVFTRQTKYVLVKTVGRAGS